MARWRHRRPVNDKIALAGVVYHLDECGSFVEDIPEDAAQVLRKFPDLYVELEPDPVLEPDPTPEEEETDPVRDPVLEPDPTPEEEATDPVRDPVSNPDPTTEEEATDPLLNLSAEELKQRLKDAGQRVLGNPSAKTLRDRVRAL